jgi:hypothetical protein
MNDALLNLLTLDRLVELIGADRLKALIERRLPVIELLAALDGSGDTQVNALRALLASWPAEGNPPSTSTAGTLEALATLTRTPSRDRPGQSLIIEGEEGDIEIEPTQTYVGPNGLILSGVQVGYCHTSEFTSTTGTLSRERFLFTDRDDWLDGLVTIERQGTWSSPSASESEARQRRITDLSSTTVMANWMTTMTFNYANIPTASEVAGLIAAGLATPSSSRHFDVKVLNAGSPTVRGRMLRDTYETGKEPLIVDHWTLIENYIPPNGTAALAFQERTTVPTLAEFFQYARDKNHKWYVQTVYQIQPV